MIDFNKLYGKANELNVTVTSGTYYAESIGRFESINVHLNDKGRTCYVIDSEEEHYEQWLECFYNCKEL